MDLNWMVPDRIEAVGVGTEHVGDAGGKADRAVRIEWKTALSAKLTQ